MTGILTKHSDEIVRAATVTSTGTTVAGYGLARLSDDKPGRPVRFNETTLNVNIDCGTATPVAVIAMIHATPEAGDAVRFQASDSPTYTTLAIDVPWTLAGWVGAGETRYPLGSALDVSTIAGFEVGGYRYYRLTFTGLGQPLWIGELRMHPTALRVEVERGAKPRPIRRGVDHVTTFGTRTAYRFQVRSEEHDLTFGGLEAADRAALLDQWDDVDASGLPFVYVPDASEPACLLAEWSTDTVDIERQLYTQATVRATIREIGRGLRPGV
jgi:hypothetical protein